MNKQLQRIIFFAALIFCVTPFASAPVALFLGVVLALFAGNPIESYNSQISKKLLQISVIGLGFGMNINAAIKSSADGFLFTIAIIAITMTAGFIIGKYLKIDKNISTLISSGTAICGGSAIAAVSTAINSKDEETAVSIGTVFILNAVGLFLFPMIGHYLNMSQESFGMWSAIAIHDTSSVVGAAQSYGDKALAIAINVKLTRALWIIPLVFAIILVTRNRNSKIQIPWFIGGYVLAMLISSYVPEIKELSAGVAYAAKKLLTVTLFFIGAGITRSNLKKVGVKPLLMGVILWILIGVISFYSVRTFY
jgi:uncharacterized integral membrane protein (TIGR00698 family)